MSKYICLDNLFAKECAHLVGERNADTRFVFDTNSFRYVFGGLNSQIIVTPGVVGELEKYSDVFAPEQMVRSFNALRIDSVDEMVSEEDEILITCASQENPKKFNRGNIGWVDMQQIGYALGRARKGVKTILISNDGDFLKTVKQLRRKYEFVKKNVACVSVRLYLERQHAEDLEGFHGSFKKVLSRTIESIYYHAA
jgi:hypothetical protein